MTREEVFTKIWSGHNHLYRYTDEKLMTLDMLFWDIANQADPMN